MIKHCIQQSPAVGYKNAKSLLDNLLPAYQKEIKDCRQLKPADRTAYMKFYDFLLKYESATFGQNWNMLVTPEIMCLVLSKLPKNAGEK